MTHLSASRERMERKPGHEQPSFGYEAALEELCEHFVRELAEEYISKLDWPAERATGNAPEDEARRK